MPDGNGPVTPQTWQPVPGADGAIIWPLIRKIDTISSNSYLITTPDAIILIDPGGLSAQANLLAGLVAECRQDQDRPVFVFLTHAHIDHFIGALTVPAFARPETAVFVVQERGAVALLAGDTELTQAGLLGVTLPSFTTGLRLFKAGWESDAGIPVESAFPDGATLNLTYDRAPCGLPHAVISFGNGPALEAFHTPGHSPDSLCLKAGDLLFTGDLLFAANPGIAGLCGWDQTALIASLEGIFSLIGAGGISVVCPGHGRAVSAPDAARMILAVLADARSLTGIAELNRERAEQAAAFAEDCMEEMNELFTIMAGRLYYVSWVMDELGETGVADQMDALFAGDMFDELLEAFSSFSEEHHRGDQVPVHLALKAGQVMGKIERDFRKDELSRIIDPTLVRRAGRLLSDYLVMFRGFSPPRELSDCAVVPLVETVVTGCSVPACPDEDLYSAADDDEAFRKILLARIGTRPLLEDVAFSLVAEDRAPVISADRDHLTDLLIYLLEELIGTGSDQVSAQVRQENGKVLITVTGNTAQSTNEEGHRKQRFLMGLCNRAGGSLAVLGNTGSCTYVITFGSV